MFNDFYFMPCEFRKNPRQIDSPELRRYAMLRPYPTNLPPEAWQITLDAIGGKVADKNHAIHCAEDCAAFALGQVLPDKAATPEGQDPLECVKSLAKGEKRGTDALPWQAIAKLVLTALIGILGVFLFAVLLLSGTRASAQAPGQAPKPPQASAIKATACQCGCAVTGVCVCANCSCDYAACKAEAVKSGKPLVVGVGCVPPPGDWVSCSVEGLPGLPKSCIVASVPRGDQLVWLDLLEPTASAQAVQGMIGRINVSLSGQFYQQAPATASRPVYFPREAAGAPQFYGPPMMVGGGFGGGGGFSRGGSC